jgi:hypothetical protein
VVVVDWFRQWVTGREGGGTELWRSPAQVRERDHPECFASACSMWSRNPIPEFMLMLWVEEVWEACSVVASRASSEPPSREIEIWILVSFVLRLMTAVRRVEAMVIDRGERRLRVLAVVEVVVAGQIM